MEWIIAAIAVVALGIAAVAAAGGLGEMARDPIHDTFHQDLPATPLTAGDLSGLRFGVALRGYSMRQVDAVLDRLGREIADRDARLAEQQGTPSGPPADPVAGRTADAGTAVQEAAVPELRPATTVDAAGRAEESQ